MSPERWQTVQRLFEAALTYEDPQQQEAFLVNACAGDDALRACIRGMLRGDASPPAVLDASITGLTSLLSEDLAPELPHVGPYRPIRELGYGGMGVVYLAERADDQFHRQVALKLVRRGMLAPDTLRRFRAERQILAVLEHPNIARLYDGGLSQDGRPYLAMEYVDGLPIDAYCDAHRLTVDERLELFTSVCEAVRFAHRNLVVHRDLKPSNILVTGDGTVKLLDFGIAKLLDEASTGDWAFQTRSAVRVLTPAYAAPEQIRGKPVSTATDVFSLGVILYELLTGHGPFREHGAAPADVERAILEQEPERPSRVVARATGMGCTDDPTVGLTTHDVGAHRGTTVARLQRRLRGDLDTILMTALRKEPERRYGSAEAFLDDIRRHLAGLPARAHPESSWYRARKFVRRHRVGVMASVLVLLSLAAGLGSALWQAREARRQRDAAEQISSFLESLFEASDPLADRAERLDTLQVRDLLARGVAGVQRELQSKPAVQARLLNVIGGVYHNLGLYEEARPLVAQALHIREALYGPAHPETAESQHALAALRMALGTYAAADSLYRLALATRKSTRGGDALGVSETVLGLAEVLRAQGRFDEAEPYYRDATILRRRAYGAAHPKIAESLSLLASLLWDRGDVARAEPMLREALAMNRETLGDRHPRVAQTLQRLAGVTQHLGDFTGAEAYLKEALSINVEVLGADHPHAVQTRHQLAVLYEDLSRYDEAERLLRDVLAIQRRRFGAAHPEVAAALSDLALVLRDKGAFEAAEPYARQAVSLWEQCVGPEHHELATSLSVHASVLKNLGRLDEAERTFRRALAMSRKLRGDDHRDTGILMTHLAELMRFKGAYDESESLYRDVLARARRTGGPDHPGVAIISGLLANVLRDAGRYEEAEAMYREALVRMGRDLPSNHIRIARARIGLGACLIALQRFDEAESVLLEGYDAVRGQSYDARRALDQLVVLYRTWGKPVESGRYEALREAADAEHEREY